MSEKKLNINDFINKKYGCLTIIGVAEFNTNIRLSKVRVKCDCGKESDKILSNVLALPDICSKQCELFGIDRTRKTVDKYINKKYGHLTILAYVGRTTRSFSRSNGNIIRHRPIVRCECDCGRMIDFNLYFVTGGSVTTCGQCNLSKVNHGITAGKEPIAMILNATYDHIVKRARTLSGFQLSKEWFNDEDPIPAIHNFMIYCRPLYEKCMNDDNPKHIFIHRIDINKPLGPGNVYFDHHIYNIHYSGRTYY